MQYGKLIRILASFSVLSLAACSSLTGSGDDDDTPTATEAPHDVAPADEATPAAGGGGGGACSRIADCCRAYVAAMGASVFVSICDAYSSVQGMQDSLCEQTMAGYRTGLTAMQKAVPAACN